MFINHYKIQRKIADGGFSKVFLGEDFRENKYAIKVINMKGYGYEKENTRIAQAAKREFEIMTLLSDHPNILTAYELEEEGTIEEDGNKMNALYISTEYCGNETIAHHLARRGAFSEEVARFYFKQLVSALGFIHKSGFGHLDIKPQNILLDENYNLRIADFGISEEDVRGDGHTNLRKGTQSYMAPEIKSKTASSYNIYKADIYSLGVTLYTMLYASLPKDNEESGRDYEDTKPDCDSEPDSCACKDHYSFSSDHFTNVMNLIFQMIHPDPLQRPSLEAILEHPWMMDPSLEIENYQVYSQVLPEKHPFINNCHF